MGSYYRKQYTGSTGTGNLITRNSLSTLGIITYQLTFRKLVALGDLPSQGNTPGCLFRERGKMLTQTTTPFTSYLLSLARCQHLYPAKGQAL